MGEPRLVHLGLIALLLAGCGGEAELLGTASVQDTVYGTGQSGGDYRPSSTDPAVRGVLQGKVTYEGRPKPRLEDISTEFCVNAHPNGIRSEDFLVAADGGLAGVVVYVKRGLARVKFDTPAESLVLDQKDCQYIPHVMVLQTGQPLVIKSSDDTMHNVHGISSTNSEFNRSMTTPGSLEPMKFYKPDVAMLVKCDVHGWMKAYVAIVPHPCAAVTAEDGTYTIPGVPPGKYLLGFWHERLGEATEEVELGPSETKSFDYLMRRQ